MNNSSSIHITDPEIVCLETEYFGRNGVIKESLYGRRFENIGSGYYATVLTSPVITDSVCFGDIVYVPREDFPNSFDLVQPSEYHAFSLHLLKGVEENVIRQELDVLDDVITCRYSEGFFGVAVPQNRLSLFYKWASQKEEAGILNFACLIGKQKVVDGYTSVRSSKDIMRISKKSLDGKRVNS